MSIKRRVQRNAFTGEELDSIAAGDILIKSDTQIPKSFRVGFEEYTSWKKLLPVNGNAVEQTALKAGWHFSFLMPATEGRAFGLNRQSAMDSAIRRVTEKIIRSGFNSLEITGVRVHRVLGLYHADVVANPRHLRPGPFLFDPNPYYYPHDFPDFDEIFWRGAGVEPEIKGI